MAMALSSCAFRYGCALLRSLSSNIFLSHERATLRPANYCGSPFKCLRTNADIVTESVKAANPENLQTTSNNKGILENGLYVVATPIGNLEDITLRALRVLKSADLILSEDTRHSRKLLNHYNIDSPLMSYHKFNESSREDKVLARLQQGQIIALISDAGTPGVSDPGEKIIKACLQKNVRVYPVPGPSAVITALTASGLPTNEFSFIGFLPSHNAARKKKLMAAAIHPTTQVLYVPPHKFLSFLEEIIAIFGEERQCVIAREMTKWHEEFWRGSLAEAKSEFSQRNPKGEITLLIHGAPETSSESPSEAELETELQALLSKGHSLSEGVKIIAEQFGVRKKAVYAMALKMHSGKWDIEDS
eukprot:TRINITY_DN9557_c0_g1_i1.p1 TRINITY_DN9557_c0_g1~~TRINITY_DN9557_c0_g1_i1.p1  ORF type:complete len:361 (-),score=71.43 TRINITY_DN9557_c0_g1_i1:644-1726(-)